MPCARRLPRCCGDSRSWNAHDVDPPPHPRLGSPSARGNIWHSSMPIPRSMGALRLRPTCSAISRSPHRVFTRWCSVWSVADSCAAPRGVLEVSKCSWPQRRFLSCADRPNPIDQNHCAEVLGALPDPALPGSILSVNSSALSSRRLNEWSLRDSRGGSHTNGLMVWGGGIARLTRPRTSPGARTNRARTVSRGGTPAPTARAHRTRRSGAPPVHRCSGWCVAGAIARLRG